MSLAKTRECFKWLDFREWLEYYNNDIANLDTYENIERQIEFLISYKDYNNRASKKQLLFNLALRELQTYGIVAFEKRLFKNGSRKSEFILNELLKKSVKEKLLFIETIALRKKIKFRNTNLKERFTTVSKKLYYFNKITYPERSFETCDKLHIEVAQPSKTNLVNCIFICGYCGNRLNTRLDFKEQVHRNCSYNMSMEDNLNLANYLK